ncbi:MAG: LamG-like jellyroll fold domain-containing protein, partial [Bdellovibrionota bacterium]
VELGRARVSLAPGNADLNGMVYGELERPVVLPPHSTVAIESYQAPAPDGYYPDARVGRNSKATFFDHCEGPLDLVADESDELALDLTDSRTRAELHGVRQNPGVGVVFEGHGYVAFENTGDLDSPGPMTIEAKIFPDRLDGIRTILAHGYTLAPKAEVSLRIRDGRYEAGSWNGASAELVSAPVPPADLHAWVELKVVFDGKNWQLFRNGKLLASKSARLGVLSIPAEWAVGGCSRGICAGGEERAFVGAIASVGITR